MFISPEMKIEDGVPSTVTRVTNPIYAEKSTRLSALLFDHFS